MGEEATLHLMLRDEFGNELQTPAGLLPLELVLSPCEDDLLGGTMQAI